MRTPCTTPLTDGAEVYWVNSEIAHKWGLSKRYDSAILDANNDLFHSQSRLQIDNNMFIASDRFPKITVIISCNFNKNKMYQYSFTKLLYEISLEKCGNVIASIERSILLRDSYIHTYWTWFYRP